MSKVIYPCYSCRGLRNLEIQFNAYPNYCLYNFLYKERTNLQLFIKLHNYLTQVFFNTIFNKFTVCLPAIN